MTNWNDWAHVKATALLHAAGNDLNLSPALLKSFEQVVLASDFFSDVFGRHPYLIAQLIDSGDLNRDYQPGELANQLQQQLSAITEEAQLHRVLREFRRREMLRLIWRNTLKCADTKTITRELSDLADACLENALMVLERLMAVTYGYPHDGHRLIVLGMGKLGGQELNLSSDIDLMFSFAEEGETQGGSKSLSHHEYFTRLGQKLIQAISNRTEDGFVFRVDMRLRPYGQSGALVLSLAAMEAYYQEQGREWERYAMIKARVVAGDKSMGAQLLTALKPFVYRKYIDFGVIESLREMKTLIMREVRKRKGDDVKVGDGGIREIEFIAQAFQLMRGGRDKHLQEKHLLTVLERLGQLNYLDGPVADELKHAYLFLRDVEHALQALKDEQTQRLPETPDERNRLAVILGFDDWPAFYQVLEKHRKTVSFHFSQIVSPVEGTDAPKDDVASDCWASARHDPEAAVPLLQQMGFADASHVAQLLHALQQQRAIQSMQEVARLRLDIFMPKLLMQVAQTSQPAQTLARILPLVESVVRRSAYLLLLNENPQALHQLVHLCEASPWVAEQLSRNPILLDELIDPQALYTLLDKAALKQELQAQLLRLPEDDLEQHMDCLRQFKNAHSLRIAACEITGILPIMKVSDYLTYLAEVILQAALDVAWQYLTHRHGVPQKDEGVLCQPDFVVVAYGKLAGLELGHGSDLDLVFLHDADINLVTDGEKALDNTVFFTRLAQRLIHLINTPTAAGVAYEVDTRLRPSGASGLLVTSLDSFCEYQLHQAWTWEHQALVRSRAVAGDQRLAQQFEALRTEVLTIPRDLQKLKSDVIEMRNKMREHLATPVDQENAVFDIKHDRGGIVDIEFMVQYNCLAWAHQYPQLIYFSDNIRELEALAAAGVLVAEDVQFLIDTYKAYRERVHQLALQKQPNKISAHEFGQQRKRVSELWRLLIENE